MKLASSVKITTDYDKVIILGGRSFMYTMKVWALEFAFVGIIFFVPQYKKNTVHHYSFILTFNSLSIRI
jgi:hypothetical protein